MLTGNQLEFFNERAAVRQYDGGMSRGDAERAAYRDTVEFFERIGEKMTSNMYVQRQQPQFLAVVWNAPGDHPAVKEETRVNDGKETVVHVIKTAIGERLVWPGHVITERKGKYLAFSPQQFERRFRPADEVAANDSSYEVQNAA
jgi:hypothetical protein